MDRRYKVCALGILIMILVGVLVGCRKTEDISAQSTPLSIQMKPDKESTPQGSIAEVTPSMNETETANGMTGEPKEGQKIDRQDAPEGALDTPIAAGTQSSANRATQLADSAPPMSMESQAAATGSPKLGQTPAGDNDTPPGATGAGTPVNETITLNGNFLKEADSYFLENDGEKIEIILGESIPAENGGTSSLEGKRVYVTGAYTDSSHTIFRVDTIFLEPSTTGVGGGIGAQNPSPSGTVGTISGMIIKKSDGGYQLKKNETNEIVPLSIDAVLLQGPEGDTLEIAGKRVVLGGMLSNGIFYVRSIYSVQ